MESTAKKVNEKRKSPRNPAEIEVVCQPYSSTGTIRHCRGILRNHSEGGIYIETPHEYKTGTILVIRTTHRAQPSSVLACGEGLRTICLAEVKWQQERSDQEPACYGVGLRYLE